ncbi:MAG: cytochrome b/b6 domain-containing protein [bacterium]
MHLFIGVVLLLPCLTGGAFSAPMALDPSNIMADNDCLKCHETGAGGHALDFEISRSIHADVNCADCHLGITELPHEPTVITASDAGCRSCHSAESDQFEFHGRVLVASDDAVDIGTPVCSDCHGTHSILAASNRSSRTHVANLVGTCGECHRDPELTGQHRTLDIFPAAVYQASIHGQAGADGVPIASCIDCHASDGTSHCLLASGMSRSSVNFFRIADNCGKCHSEAAHDFQEGIHGLLVARGETEPPICTDCHGVHGIMATDNPAATVSRAGLAVLTCSRCHESALLQEKYGLLTDQQLTFIDRYHGLKTKTGDARVANCESCHGPHRILPSADRASNLFWSRRHNTCGKCHIGISIDMAMTAIHGVGDSYIPTQTAKVVDNVHLAILFVLIGLMASHGLIDLGRQLRDAMTKGPRVRRLRPVEIAQHAALASSFIVLVITGFAMRYEEGILTRILFGWDGGFELRRLLHRIAAVVMISTLLWHLVFLFTAQGRRFFAEVRPRRDDFIYCWQRFLANLGRRKKPVFQGRFSYVEKVEYWGVAVGSTCMNLTGLLLWFDNILIHSLPRSVLDVALVVHFREAWLAALAIGVWHLYSVLFNPRVSPMNPACFTGTIPESMYALEHLGDLERARAETLLEEAERASRLIPLEIAADRPAELPVLTAEPEADLSGVMPGTTARHSSTYDHELPGEVLELVVVGLDHEQVQAADDLLSLAGDQIPARLPDAARAVVDDLGHEVAIEGEDPDGVPGEGQVRKHDA